MVQRKHMRIGAVVVTAAALVAGTLALSGGALAGLDSADGRGEVRSVIYLLGDGMGRTYVTAGRERF